METIKGYIDHIIYRNAENGYSVFQLNAEEEVICVGTLKISEQGETLEAQGDYVEHPVYGRQFKVEQYRIVPPEDVISVERYLASGAVHGVGAALASRIVKAFGEDTFRIMEEEPERLSEIRGISERKAREIGESLAEKKGVREAMIFLQKYGISNTLAVRIYEKYGLRIYSVLQENPYQIAEDIEGIGFKIADEIAARVGIHTDSDYRIRSGILYVLLHASSEGNIYLPNRDLLRRASALLELSPEQMEPQLQNLAMDKKLVIKKSGEEIQVYAGTLYYAELSCARMLADLKEVTPEGQEEIRKDEILHNIVKLEEETGFYLDELQREAVVTGICSTVLVLTGGPGTGKTTTINMMIRYFEKEGLNFNLAAPTGRAAKRMTETTGYEAKTIHRLLELSGNTATSFERDEENPLDTDVIIVDEMSMVDIYLLQSLLRAVVPGTRLILVGDANQLPSVGPGQVLKDIIASHTLPVVQLEKIFRQSEESDIVMNAHRIHRGEQIELNNKSRDFFFLERSDTQVIYKHMIQLIQDKLPRYLNVTPYDIQVLTPMRKGSLGVEILNRILQEYLNPPDKKKEEYIKGEQIYRTGDKVMQIKNNYQLEWEIVSRYGIPVDKGMGVFNGDVGMIKEVNHFSQSLTVEFDEGKRVSYPFVMLEELEPAFAITIHKSQGSEYPAVIMPLLTGPRMLFNRNLLYTGVTRARSLVTILGSRQTVFEMIKNAEQQKRYTALADRMRELERS